MLHKRNANSPVLIIKQQPFNVQPIQPPPEQTSHPTMPSRNSAFLMPTPLIPTIHRTGSLTDSPIHLSWPRRTNPARMSAPPAPSPTPALKPSVPSAFDWRNQWYPVAWIVDLPQSPYPFTLWDKPLVLFQDSKTHDYVVFDDVCPHRAGTLSDGILVDTDEGTQIRCSYHGWRFNTSGTCTDIPYSKTIPKAACMKKHYPTAVWQRLLFVWFGEKPPDKTLLPVPELTDTVDDVVMTRGFRRTLPLSFIADLENLVDPSHVDWVHHGTDIGDRSRIPRDAGVEARWEHTGNLEARVLETNGKSGYAYRITFQPPCTVFYYDPIKPKFGLWHRPITRDQCEFFSVGMRVKPPRMARFLQWITPRWLYHAYVNYLTDADVVVAQRQMVGLQARNRDGYGGDWKKMFLLANGRWDTMVKHFRRFIDVNAVGMPWESALNGVERRLPMQDANNRLLYHTRDCTSCSRALRWATRALWTAGVCMNLGAVLAISAALVGRSSVRRSGVAAAGVVGLGICLVSGVLAVAMMKLRQSMIYTTKAYDVSH